MATKLYVGNLSWGTTEDSLRELFSQYGEVHSASIIRDHQTARSRGFGFVEMENAENAIRSLNGTVFQGRSIKVSEAGESQEALGIMATAVTAETEIANSTK
ncbi:MAG: RNA-binding protein [Fibrobacter sp.]|nr:RNA-binding protein [Fibrobacter sp.]